jgi:HD-like signal output (HDOD) protein
MSLWRQAISTEPFECATNGRPRRGPTLNVCVDRILKSEGVPPFTKSANDLMLKTLDFESNSREMGALILKDLGLTSQILRLANSALFNRSGRPILSVAHAMVLLGWDRVRNLVSTARFVEHFADRSAGLRELMLLSVLTAVHCREVARASGYPRPEEAYLWGLFRNIGEVLIACHYPIEYASILLAMQAEKIPLGAACLRVLNFRSDDIGLRVLAGWNMPPRICCALAGAEQAGPPMDRSAASIADYARELTHAIYRDGAGVDAVNLQCVLDAEGNQTLVSVRDLCQIVDSAASETEATFTALGVPAARLRLEKQAERARTVLETYQVFTAPKLAALDHAVDQATRTLRQPGFELTAFVTGLLDAVREAGFERVVFGLVNGAHTAIRGRLASGTGAEDVLRDFEFQLNSNDGVLQAALEKRTDVLVDRDRDSRCEDSHLVASLRPTAFALFPIIVDGRIAGCLYADRLTASPGLEMVRPSLVRVRNTMTAAIRSMAHASLSNGRG